MIALWRRRLVVFCVVLALLLPVRTARADTLKTDATLIVVGIVLITVAITVAVVVVVRHSPSITGCVAEDGNGFALEDESDHARLVLAGDTTGLKAGDRIQVKGKKKGKDAQGSRRFVVEKLRHDYGLCKATP